MAFIAGILVAVTLIACLVMMFFAGLGGEKDTFRQFGILFILIVVLSIYKGCGFDKEQEPKKDKDFETYEQITNKNAP